MRKVVPGQGAIATAQDDATEAGILAYRGGGNAIDAALASALALAVTYPHNTSIGGDAVALVRTPNGQITCINATGWAPSSVSREKLVERYGRALPDRGPDTITVPGALRAFEDLHRIGARLSWGEHFRVAQRLAAEGVLVGRSLANALRTFPEWEGASKGMKEIFAPNGRPLQAGDCFRQPSLAATLGILAQEGADAFYCGSISRDLVQGLDRQGVPIGSADLMEYHAANVEPIATDFAGHKVLTSPPNTQGFSLLKYLNVLRDAGVDTFESICDRADLFASIFLDANQLRDTILADPAFVDMNLDELVSPRLSVTQTKIFGRPQIADGDTVGVAAADSEGYAVSLIFSLFKSFGSGILEPQTGVLLQDRGTAFSLSEDSPNAIAPRKRPKHTLMPVLVLNSRGELDWVQATMGGSGQPQIHAQLLARLFHGGSLRDALEAPRMIAGARSADDVSRTVYVEKSVSEGARIALQDFSLHVVPDRTDWMGHANLVRLAAKGLEAAADPRSDGSGAVVDIENIRAQ